MCGQEMSSDMSYRNVRKHPVAKVCTLCDVLGLGLPGLASCCHIWRRCRHVIRLSAGRLYRLSERLCITCGNGVMLYCCTYLSNPDAKYERY